VRPIHRKTSPKVRGGKVQRKNRTALSPSYGRTPLDRPVVDRQRPGPAYRHLLTKQHVYQFIDLLPEWDDLSKGLKAIVLAPGEAGSFGWHRPGIVAVCAWDRELEIDLHVDFIEEHQDVLTRLGVEERPIVDEAGSYPDFRLCGFVAPPASLQCQLTRATWDNVAGLCDPFTTGSGGHQWLDRTGEIAVLLSADGTW